MHETCTLKLQNTATKLQNYKIKRYAMFMDQKNQSFKDVNSSLFELCIQCNPIENPKSLV